jgi:Apea-like HEPN
MTLPDLNDRIVYTLSALEGLLLKNASEPLQQNLAERMAFLLFKEAEARWDTVRNLRAVYDMRSKYIHHRVSLSDERELEMFVRNANFTLSQALRFSSRFIHEQILSVPSTTSSLVAHHVKNEPVPA